MTASADARMRRNAHGSPSAPGSQAELIARIEQIQARVTELHEHGPNLKVFIPGSPEEPDALALGEFVRHAALDIPWLIDQFKACRDALASMGEEAESRFIEGIVSHWFIQGGEMQFGSIGSPQNADEAISGILSVVRNHLAAAHAREQRVRLLLLEIERHCPCGARPESPTTHPHVIGCPVEAALKVEK